MSQKILKTFLITSTLIISITGLMFFFTPEADASVRALPEGETHHSSSAPGYCSSYGGSHAYEYIQNASYTQQSGGTIAITVFIYIANPTGCVAGESCPEYDNSPEYINAWIDWDGDQVFESNERVLDAALTGYIGINYHGTMSTSNIVTVPENAVGSTWMRVNLGWSHDPNDPCQYSWTWGDVVDKEIQIEDIFSKKLAMIEELESYGLDESGSRMLLESLRVKYDGASEEIQEKIIYEVERMIIGETVTNSAVTEGTSLSNSVGRSAIGALWTALIVPDLIEVALDVCWFKAEIQKEILRKQMEAAKTFKHRIGKISGIKMATVEQMEDEVYQIINSFYNIPDLALGKLKEFRESCEGQTASIFNEAYLNKGGIKIGIPLLPTYLTTIEAPTIKEGINKLNKLIREDKIKGTSEKAEQRAEGYIPLIETTGEGVKGISDAVYYVVDFGFIDDTTELILGDIAADKVSPIIKEGIPKLLETAGKIGKKASKVLYPITVGGKVFSAGFGSQGLGLMGFEHKFGEIHISDPDAWFPSPWLVITDPPGSNLDISAWISEAKESVNNLIIVLDELYETIESGNGTEIEAQVREYLNISKIAIEKVSKASSSLEDVTSICTSLEDYHQMKSNLYDAEIDMETDDMLLGFYLYAYFEEPGSTTALDKVRNQINKVKTSAYSVEDSFSTLETIISLWVPVVTKTVPVSEVGATVPIDFTVYNIGTLDAPNVSIEIMLPEGVTATETEWNIGDLGVGENAMLHTDITFTQSEDFIIEILASDGTGHNASSAIYVDIVPILSANFTNIFSDYGTDMDNDGLYNYLAVNVGLNVTIPGAGIIKGELYDTDGDKILETEKSTFLDVGDHLIILESDGFSIFSHKVNGPYVLILTLEDEDGNILDSKTYTTSAYDYIDFQHLVVLTGNYSDYGTDEDSDGIFDYLTVDAEVILANPGYAVIKARLMDANEQEIVWAENTAYLEADQHQIIQLNFDGETIYNHRVDGPYYLRDVYIYHTGDPLQPDYAYEAYTTGAYSYGQFGGNLPPIADADGPYEGYVGFPITFDGSASYDPEGQSLQYRWDFDNDGIWDTEWLTEPFATHTWLDDWTGLAKLEVSDGQLTDTDTASVTVKSPRTIKQETLSELEAAKTGDELIDAEIDLIIQSIEKSLIDNYWLDSSHLDSNYGRRVFSYQKEAVERMEKDLLRQDISEEVKEVFRAVIDQLAKADEILAVIILKEAEDTPIQNPRYERIVQRYLTLAEKELAKAYRQLAQDEPEGALDSFRRSWEYSQRAVIYANR